MQQRAGPSSDRSSDVHARYRALASLDEHWLSFPQALGFDIVRGSESFVSFDGEGVLNVAPDEDLDPDDTVAALVLHELCHCAVAGERRRRMADWGLTYAAEPDLRFEHAALRLQRSLAASVGIQDLLHPTTVHRSYYDALAAVDDHGRVAGRRVGLEGETMELAEKGEAWMRAQDWWLGLQRLLARTAACGT